MIGKRFHCTLPEEVYNELDQSAKQQSISKSELVCRRLSNRSQEVEVLYLGPCVQNMYKLYCYIGNNKNEVPEDFVEYVSEMKEMLNRFIDIQRRSKY